MSGRERPCKSARDSERGGRGEEVNRGLVSLSVGERIRRVKEKSGRELTLGVEERGREILPTCMSDSMARSFATAMVRPRG